MNPFILISLLASLLPAIHAQFNATLTNWITTENATALSRIFANIGPTGQYVPDADPGAIVAAPSTASPNYYYQVRSTFEQADRKWVRDAALTYQYLSRLYAGGNSSLEFLFMEYERETRTLQHLDTLSGDFDSGGLGDPKYVLQLELKLIVDSI
jgi:glucoamylase